MAYTYFVLDPDHGPTHAEKNLPGNKIQFRSMGLTKNDDPPPFMVVFESTQLASNYDTGSGTSAVGGGGLGDLTFLSTETANGKYHEFEITLLKKYANGNNVQHPDGGYKYTIIMNGQAWDPRIVPK